MIGARQRMNRLRDRRRKGVGYSHNLRAFEELYGDQGHFFKCPYRDRLDCSSLGKIEVDDSQSLSPIPQSGDSMAEENCVPCEHDSDQSDDIIGSEVDCQSNVDLLELLKEIFVDIGIVTETAIDKLVSKKIELFVCLIVSLADSTSVSGAMSTITLYLNNFTDKSVIATMTKYITDLFFEPQAGVLNETCLPNFVKMMRMARDEFQRLKRHEFFPNFSKFLGLLVTAGLCEVSDVTFDIGKFRCFEPNLAVVHGSVSNVMEAIFTSITFFAERLYYCFKNKTLRPLFEDSNEAAVIEDEFMFLQQCWRMHVNGNMESEMKINSYEFEDRLTKLGAKLRAMSKSLRGFEKKVIDDKLFKVRTILCDLSVKNTNGDIRRAPFVVEIYGDSAVGKSTLCKQLMNVLLASQNLDVSPNFQCTINENDQYLSSYDSSKLAVILDDFANTRADKTTMAPTKMLVELKNNAPAYANKAEIESKGKVALKPEIVMITTNDKTLGAYNYSVMPYSIQRRADVVLTVRLRDQCVSYFEGKKYIDKEKCAKWHESNKFDTELIDDIWLVDVEQAVRPDQLDAIAHYAPFVDENTMPMQGVSFKHAIEFLIPMYDKFRREEFELVASSDKRTNADYSCCGFKGCKVPKSLCHIHAHERLKLEKTKAKVVETPEVEEAPSSFYQHLLNPYKFQICGLQNDEQEFEEQSGALGEKFDAALEHVYNRTTDAWFKNFTWLGGQLESASVVAILAAGQYISYYFDWMMLLPEDWVRSDSFVKLAMMANKRAIAARFIYHIIVNWILFCIVMYCWFYGLVDVSLVVIVFALSFFRQLGMSVIVKDAYRKELLKRNRVLPSLVERRNAICASAGKACVALAAIYTISRIGNMILQKRFKPQGSLRPKTDEEITKRDKEENSWSENVVRPLPMTNKGKSSTPKDLLNNIQKSLFYAEVTCEDNKTYVANVLFLRTNLFVLPKHYFRTDKLSIRFFKDHPTKTGGRFETKLHPKQCFHVPDTDLMLCYTAAGGTMGELLDYLPTGDVSPHQFSLHYRKSDGTMLKGDGYATVGEVSNGVETFEGGRYAKLSLNTFNGMCGAVLISHGSGSAITGFHLGGNAGTPKGCYGTLQLTDVILAMQELDQKNGILFTGNPGKGFSPHLRGKLITRDEPVHKKSALHFLPPGAEIECVGQVIGKKSSYTSVKDTPISPLVAYECGFPNEYMPPKIKPEWFGWQKCLANMAIPAREFPYELLDVAVQDYKEQVHSCLKGRWLNMAPLTDEENLLGIDGVRFIDKIVENTSMSVLGLSPSAKSHYIEKIENSNGEIMSAKFDDETMQMINEADAEYRKGNRVWTIAIASKKDEIHTKEKCRIFFGNPITLTWEIRKYFLPLARFMQMNPLVCECSVGINSHGPEWEEFQKHVLQFGEDRVLGGDYGKYDQKLSSQILIAAFDVLISLAGRAKYSETDILAMKTIVSDVVYSLIAVNGDLVKLVSGSHISGNSLTVVLNGICGSLNLRCAFYNANPPKSIHERMKFCDYVALMTYGDDNIGSISSEVDNFNIKVVSEFLGEYGQTYTMPDKESEIVPFLPIEDFEFLKRKNVYHPELGCHVGALVEKSIFKSLHCYLRGKSPALTQEMACATNIDGALREWFAHGKETYEERRSQMKRVAQNKINGIALESLCVELDLTYEDRVERWKQKYAS